MVCKQLLNQARELESIRSLALKVCPQQKKISGLAYMYEGFVPTAGYSESELVLLMKVLSDTGFYPIYLTKIGGRRHESMLNQLEKLARFH